MGSNAPLRVQVVDHTSREVALRIHHVQMRAYSLEAALLGAVRFPPLERTVDDVMARTETFYAAFAAGKLVGALGLSQGADGASASIDSLVVSPDYHRRGAGRALVEAVLADHGHKELFVQTGAKNEPALALYARCGFAEVKRWLAGTEPLELVRLRRVP